MTASVTHHGTTQETAIRAATLFAPATRTAPPRVCVVAEIGVNHDGDIARALQLVAAAADVGADAVKLQWFDPRHLLSNQAALADYQKEGNNNIFAMLDRLKLDRDEMRRVRSAAVERGLRFIVTPFSLKSVDELADVEVDAVKIASPDAVNRPLLRRVARLDRPLIVSTGTATLDELVGAADIIAAHRRGGCLLQCVSSYPTPAVDTAIGGMVALAERFDLPVGYSDHTDEITTGALAVAAGACVVEKHLTYDRSAHGPDHAASFDTDQFARYVRAIRHTVQMRGPTDKVVRPVEQEVRGLSRQSVCLTRDLQVGHVLEESDLTVKRPGTGIPAAEFENVAGRRLGCDVKGNDLLRFEDLVGEVPSPAVDSIAP